METALLSIIIPAYNASQYITDCILSVMASTYKDFEILLIDDGSTDGTSVLCDQFAEEYPCIKVFHTENRGLSAARNLGLEHASGQYIGFVDSDDCVASNMFGMLMDAIETSNADISVCGYVRCQRRDPKPASLPGKNGMSVVTEHADIARNILYGGYGVNVWNKLYRKSMLKQRNIAFRVDCGIAEDLYFTMEYLQYCTVAAFIDEKLYYYIMNETSLMNSFRNHRIVGDKYMSLPRAWRYTVDIVSDISEELMIYSQARTAMFYQTVLRKLENPGREYIKEAAAFVKKHKSTLRRYRWGWKYYLSALVLSLSYPLWATVFRRGIGKAIREDET